MSMTRDVSASAPASGTSRSSGILISFITAIAVFAVGQVIVSHIKSATAEVAAPEPLARATTPAAPPVAAAPAAVAVAANPTTPPANAAPGPSDPANAAAPANANPAVPTPAAPAAVPAAAAAPAPAAAAARADEATAAQAAPAMAAKDHVKVAKPTGAADPAVAAKESTKETA